jgi:hypothetical protein
MEKKQGRAYQLKSRIQGLGTGVRVLHRLATGSKGAPKTRDLYRWGCKQSRYPRATGLFFLIFCGLIVQLGRLGRSLESGDPELRDIDIKPQEKDGRRAGTGIGAELQGGCTAARGENGKW